MRVKERLSVSVGILAILIALFLIAAGASDEADLPGDVVESPYGLYVAGVAVTEENASDILHDGSAVYDPENRLLQLHNFITADYVSYEYYRYSVLATQKTDIRITGYFTVAQGIRADQGDVCFDDAELTFAEGSMLACRVAAGTLTIRNSTVWFSHFASAREVTISPFSALHIALEGVDASVEGGVIGNTVDAVFHAEQTLSASYCHLEIETGSMLATFAFYAGEGMQFDHSDIRLTSQMNGFYVPHGTLSVQSCDVYLKRCFYGVTAAALEMDGTDFDAQIYYQGIELAPDPDGEGGIAVSRITDSTLTLKNPGFSHLARKILKGIWEEGDRDLIAENYGLTEVSYTAFKEAYRSRYLSDTTMSAGLVVSYTSLSLDGCRFDIDGYSMALYGEADSRLSWQNCTGKLKAEQAAILFFTAAASDWQWDESLYLSTGDIRCVELGGYLAQFGGFVYTVGKEIVFHPEVAVSAENPQALFDALDGMAKSVSVTTYPYAIRYVAAAVVLSGMAVLVTAVVFHVRKKHGSRKRQKGKQR